MNKFITKIVGAALGLTMAIGVGVAVGVNNSEAREVSAATKDGSWDLTSSDANFYGEYETYFSQPYGFKSANQYIANKSVTDFSTSGTTSIKVGIKCLQNGSTSNRLTVWLINSSGETLGDGIVLTPPNAAAASSTDWVYATFTSSSQLTGANGFMAKLTTKNKNTLVNGANYVVTYNAGPTKLATPEPSYDNVSRKVSWANVDGAESYEVSSDNVNYTEATSPYDGSFVNDTEYTIYVKAIGNNSTTLTSDAGSVTFTPTAPVSVTGVTLNKASTTIEKGANETLTATVSPVNATNKNLTWTSSASTIASVSSAGVVTGLKPGSTTITVETEDGGFTASCDVTVTMITEVVFDATIDIADSATGPLTKNGASISLSSSGGALNNGTDYRCYKGKSFYINSAVENIIQVELKGQLSNPISNMEANVGTLTTKDADGVWKGSAKSIRFTASEAQARIERVVIFYDDGKEHVELQASDVTVEVGKNSSAISVTNKATSAVITGCSFVAGDEEIATVSNTGVVTGVALGKTTITISKSSSNETSYFSKVITVNVIKGVISIAEANEIIEELDNNETTDYKVQLTGYIIDMSSENSYLIADEKVGTSGNSITVYGIYNNNALRNYSVLNGELTVRGNLQKYVKNDVTTFEIKDIEIVSYSDDAMTFAKASYEALQAHCNSGTQAITSEEWATLASNWNDVDSYSKVKLQGATASYAYSDDIAHWISRYTIITTARTDLAAFMAPAQGSSNVANNNANNSTALLIIVISSISLVAVSGYFVIKRRREN